MRRNDVGRTLKCAVVTSAEHSSEMNQRMRQLNQLARSSTCAALILLFASCGQSGLSDDATGFIDLVPFYPVTSAPGVVPANPNANLPLVMTPRRGWFAGQRVEYYDFGPVGNVRKRNAAGSEIREPFLRQRLPDVLLLRWAGTPHVLEAGVQQ